MDVPRRSKIVAPMASHAPITSSEWYWTKLSFRATDWSAGAPGKSFHKSLDYLSK